MNQRKDKAEQVIPIQRIPGLETPHDSARLWRYMGIYQFLALITTSTLHFTRIDQFEDKWEGAMPEPTKAAAKKFAEVHRLPVDFVSIQQRFKKVVYASCWHENENESAAMWRLYGQYDSNIAIITSTENLRKSLPPKNNVVYYLAKVNYIDYNVMELAINDALTPFFLKRKNYCHENEVRMLMLDINALPDPEKNGFIGGQDMSLDLNTLITQIYISPAAPDWYVSAVTNVCEKFGIPKGLIHKSTLDEDPVV